jgi:hypothetical protein
MEPLAAASDAAQALSRWRGSQCVPATAVADSRKDRQGLVREWKYPTARRPREVMRPQAEKGIVKSWSRSVQMWVMKAWFRERARDESSAWRQARHRA